MLSKSVRTAKVVPFSQTFTKASAQPFERMGDHQHLTIALESSEPLSYISSRAGLVSYKGKPGIGFVNAIDLHVAIIKPDMAQGHLLMDGMTRVLLQSNQFCPNDFKAAWKRNSSLEAAIKRIGKDKLPDYVLETLGANYYAIQQQQAHIDVFGR